jgi:hypothetical protein
LPIGGYRAAVNVVFFLVIVVSVILWRLFAVEADRLIIVNDEDSHRKALALCRRLGFRSGCFR